DREGAQRADDLLPEPHAPGNVRVGGEVVPLGVVAVREHGDDRGAVDAGRVVDGRLRETETFQLLDAPLGEPQHVVLWAEVQASRRARLDARGLEPDGNPVHAERALGHLAGRLREAGHVERASRLAVLAADALVRVDVDDAVLVLDDRAGRGAGLEAARL